MVLLTILVVLVIEVAAGRAFAAAFPGTFATFLRKVFGFQLPPKPPIIQ